MFKICILLLIIASVSCRIHKLHLTDDVRHSIDLTTFGFYKKGVLDVKLTNFQLPKGAITGDYGFTLRLTKNDVMSLEPYSEKCYLKTNYTISPLNPAIIYLKMDLKKLRMNVSCDGKKGLNMHILHNRTDVEKFEANNITLNHFLDRCTSPELIITKETHNGYDYYSTSFAMYVASNNEQGLYNVYFHSCPYITSNFPNINAMFEIYESNTDNFLSAGEMPLPRLYSIMSLIFFMSAGLWTFMLKTSKHPVYRIHILMCILVYLKALSLAFHGINYHFIKIRGEHVTAWAILFYITHLLKGAVLFVTIVLVGTGWNFIKHILSDRDKKLFMIVIPLQVVANVAEIIIAESEVGDSAYYTSREVFILIDFLCCGAILFPFVGSIRHLQDASSTDGKAAINLEKLKLFRHFYIMVICYIYFTRFIVYILKISVPFQYSWIDELFREMATYIFFVLTGYKFRPAAANPYFQPTLEADIQCTVVSDIGVCEGVNKLSHRNERTRENKKENNCMREDMQPLMKSYDSE